MGFETQRQWSEMAIRRTTPALLGLFSLITLFAHRRMAPSTEETVRRVAWYRKPHPTFSDALALVRKDLWAKGDFLRVACAERHGKSPTGISPTPNRRGLLRSVNG